METILSLNIFEGWNISSIILHKKIGIAFYKISNIMSKISFSLQFPYSHKKGGK